MVNELVLPDSRLKDPKGTVLVDWPLPSGGTVRLEMEMVYCANCGVEFGYVPRENTTFAFWLCNQCFEVYGAVAGTYAEPDMEFNRRVEQEMQDRFGRTLTELELATLADQGRLPAALELLARESPYPCRDRRPRG